MARNRRFEDETKVATFGIRHLQCVLLFFGVAVAFMLRVNLSLAIVAMTDTNTASSNETTIEKYQWSEKTKSWVLSSFFCGYFMTQIPNSQLAHKYGGKILALNAIFISSILTILTPLGAHLGNWQLVCALRFIMGLVQSSITSSAHTILAKWAPVEERGILCTFSYSGIQFGTVAMLSLGGFLASSSYGWPSIFYFSGGLGLVWSLVWFIWGASTPRDYKSISEAECQLIETSLGQVHKDDVKKSHMAIPWTKILISAPFYVLVAAQSAAHWGFITLLTQLPAYMKNVLGKDMKSNALLSALPFLVTAILGFVFSFIGKALQKHNCMSLTANRKLFNTISQWIPTLSFIGLGYVTADHANLAVVLLTVTVGVSSAACVGWGVNHIDLSPNFAGILMGLGNFVSSFMSFTAPLVVGFVVNDEKDPAQWRIVFFISAGVYFVGNLLFILFGSAKIQPWNDATTAEQPLEYVKVKTDLTPEDITKS